jgi:hypothetical protein
MRALIWRNRCTKMGWILSLPAQVAGCQCVSLWKLLKKKCCHGLRILLASLSIAPRGAGANWICPEMQTE